MRETLGYVSLGMLLAVLVVAAATLGYSIAKGWRIRLRRRPGAPLWPIQVRWWDDRPSDGPVVARYPDLPAADDAWAMISNRDIELRRRRVLELSAEKYLVSEIALKLGVSQDTIKKDREWLRDNGLLPKG